MEDSKTVERSIEEMLNIGFQTHRVVFDLELLCHDVVLDFTNEADFEEDTYCYGLPHLTTGF